MKIYIQYVKFLFVDFNMRFHGITACNTWASITENATASYYNLRYVDITEHYELCNTSIGKLLQNYISYKMGRWYSVRHCHKIGRLVIQLFHLALFSLFPLLFDLNQLQMQFFLLSTKTATCGIPLGKHDLWPHIWRDLLYCSELKEMWLLVVQFSELCLAKNASKIWTPTSAPSK